LTGRNDGELSRWALLLRNAAPEQWIGFMEQFQDYVDETVYAVSEAPSEEVIRMQGRALALRTVLRIFQECNKARPRNG
jgi:hypothetical protein